MALGKKQKNDLAKYERQRELARERQRRRRAAFTPEQLEHKRAKDRERLARLKIENKIKSIDQLTPREQRNIRKVWRESKRKRRAEIKVQKETADNMVTPPQSEDEHGESEQKKRGRKKVRRDRSKAYKKIKEQEKYIKNLQRKLEKYKKRCSLSPKKRVSNFYLRISKKEYSSSSSDVG